MTYQDETETMKALRLHGMKDLRFDDVDKPPQPAGGQILLRVRAVGICGSDLHMYDDGCIGGTVIESPMVLGHEFMGEVAVLGDEARDGHHQPLRVGQRVAVEPACPCWVCELCEKGHQNLCPNHTFYGAYPTDGALRDFMIVEARNCFPIPDAIGDGAGTMLETLGVALHAVDLSKVKVADTVAVIGCGPVGLLILQVAKLAGASRIFAFDKLDWRVEKARELGATAWNVDSTDVVSAVRAATNGRGVDVAFESAWADESVQLAGELARIGGRVVLVGIPADDKLTMKQSTARRKGLSIMMSHRMKHTYPRAIALAESGMIDLDGLISHHFPLDDAQTAFAKNASYADGVHKIIISL